VIIDAGLLASDPAWQADVIIIGSGASGALWAQRLAAAGRDVLVLEEGAHVESKKFNQREGDMYRLLYRDGANQRTYDQRVNVLQGRCLGGSTVVNMADVERIPEGVLAHWRKLTGIEEFREDVFTPYFERCEVDIGANRISAAELNRNNDLLREGTERLGIHGAPLMHNRVGCVGSGYCLLGCTYDAKQSTLITLLPRAIADGARVAVNARVGQVETAGGEVRAVVGERLDATGQVVGTFRATARTVVLAAGAVHSPLILARSGIQSPALGKNLSLQPQIGISALFDEDVRAFRGIPQAYGVDGFEEADAERGLHGFRIEGISGGPAMTAMSAGFLGREQQAYMAAYAQTASALILVPDRPVGEVRLRSGSAAADIRYALTADWIETAWKGVRAATEIYFAAGAKKVVLPGFPGVAIVSPKELPAKPAGDFAVGRVTAISAHPQGTCRMGTQAKTSVVNPDGRHHAVRNLYVIDASLFPTTASTHTMLPIMGVADWLADRYLAGKA
jgi:choline dehydrogenase-like flavoprotein